ncbi:XRE family transcriptional regulator [Streptosporangium sp. 'caverna']|uniref:XRE family transcriptional regulator n=1 Tax=Streptosporangium sp. 'caverna' TaxID=2202249 RepID=UPI001EF7B356|nr:XRE family transcriptional regulator [Streptosporangium sp. 'caverna']
MRLFNLAVKYSGASQTRLSTATGIAQGHVSLIIRGRRQVTDLEVYEWIATGLGLPDHARMLFGLAPVDLASPTGDHDDNHQEQADELTARIEAAAAIDPVMVMILSTDTNNLRLLDRRLGGVAIADKMRAQITQVERAHQHAVRPGIRTQLAHVLAETSSLAGWQAINTGALNDAWDHYEHAKAAAREADDPAILGDETTCRAALDQAAALLSEGDADPDMPYLSVNTHHLGRWRGACLVRFGDPGTVEDLRSALAGMDGTYNRAESGVRCDLGHALLVRGEPEAAQPHIQRAQHLATMTGSRRQRRRIEELARAVKRSLH